MNMTKNDISICLRGSAQWRTGRDTAFPGDPRNQAAAACLSALADQCDHMTESDWLLLAPYQGLDRPRWMRTISLACRQVGFSRPTPDFSVFVTNLAALLNAKVAA